VRSPHHPVVTARADGRWVVTCPECQSGREGTTPVGIGVPLRSRHVADLVRENHTGRRVGRGAEARSITGRVR